MKNKKKLSITKEYLTQSKVHSVLSPNEVMGRKSQNLYLKLSSKISGKRDQRYSVVL